jgi:hypothetical protein
MARYRLYFEDVNITNSLEEYLYNDVDHFFYTKRVSREDYLSHLSVIRENFLAYNCEISQDRGDHVWRIRPGLQNAAPVWRLETGDLDELRKTLDSKPETIFIEYFESLPNGAPHFLLNAWGKPYWRGTKLREFLEIKVEYPETEFIGFGSFYFNFYFRMGMEGGAVRARTAPLGGRRKGDSTCYQFDPAGNHIYRSPMKNALHIASRYRSEQITMALIRDGAKRGVRVPEVRAIMTLQATPDYQEQVRGVELSQEYDAIKFLPEYFFPEDVNRPTQLLPRELPILSQALPGDKKFCDSCTLKYRCPVFKPGSVCIVAGSDGKALVDFFGSRNTDDVLSGLSAVLRKQAERVEGAVEQEEETQKIAKKEGKPVEYSEQVTKMLDKLQSNGERYLKLIDPRFTKPVVQINNSNNAINGPAPREIDPAQAVDELVHLGMHRDQITADHVERYLSGTWNGPNEQAMLEKGNPRVIDEEIGF